MTAAIPAGRTTFLRALTRPDTPVRLRLLSWLAAAAAAALLTVTSVLMARLQTQVGVIGDQAAPRAATAADLHFALSDMDAQFTRMVLAGDADDLAAAKIDALGLYRERGRQADAAIESLSRASPQAEVVDALAVYRQRVGQTLTAQEQRSASDALGHYTQATNVLHLQLLPAAQRLREASEAQVEQAYAEQQHLEIATVAVMLVLGGALLGALLVLQVWMARRFRRTVNPALAAATGIALALIVAVIAIPVMQVRRLDEARGTSLTPFLTMSRMRAVGYDAATDTSRFVLSSNLAYYREGFDRKAQSLRSGLAGQPALPRWLAYEQGHQRIVALAGSGRTGEAVRALTGIRRGDAAFDFAYFDDALASSTAVRRGDFERAVRTAKGELTGWVTAPAVALGAVIALVPIGVRRRLAEYR